MATPECEVEVITSRVHLGIDVGKTGVRIGTFSTDLVLVERWSVPSDDVDCALAALQTKLRELLEKYETESVGVSVFGPLETDPENAAYGSIIESSEPAWSGVNVPRQVAAVLQHDTFFDFDVNAGALAEATVGNGRGRSSFVYLSVGTGIGAIYFKRPHEPGYAPQIGHMQIPREKDDVAFEGSCRFHGDCLQGLASGRALAQRWGRPAESLEAGHPAWDLEARYLARACTNLIYAFSPNVVLLGSSVGTSTGLKLQTVNRYVHLMVNNFLDPGLREAYAREPAVISAALGVDCSLVGAALLGRNQLGLRLAGPRIPQV